MPISDDELNALISDLESDRVERKGSWQGDTPEKVRQAICAFSNDLPNHRKDGILLIGVSDTGAPTCLEITDKFLLTLADIKTDGKITPPPSLTVEKRELPGNHHIALIQVRPSDSPPVRYDGRTWIRIGPRRAVASAHEERILTEKRTLANKSFDIRSADGATLSDLDLRFFSESYLPLAIARNVLEENGRSIEEQLASLKFLDSMDRLNPTNLALLVLGKATIEKLPGAFVQFVRFDGDKMTHPIVDEATISGRLDEVIKRTEDKFNAHNSVGVDLTSEEKETRTFTYPLVAFQQLFRNAIMHRAYEHTNSPIRISWYADRLEILSPGGPFGVVTPENFGQPGVTDYRNPNVAEAMKNLGYAQRFGVGIATAKQALHANGNADLEYAVSSSFTLLTLKR